MYGSRLAFYCFSFFLASHTAFCLPPSAQNTLAESAAALQESFFYRFLRLLLSYADRKLFYHSSCPILSICLHTETQNSLVCLLFFCQKLHKPRSFSKDYGQKLPPPLDPKFLYALFFSCEGCRGASPPRHEK